MNIEEVKEWLRFADDDLYSAKILNDAVRKPHEIICYHCAQAVEKYLKGYLISRDIIPEKSHNLLFLNRICTEKDNDFCNIQSSCDFLNQFATAIRYPHKYDITENDVDFSIKAAEKVKNSKPITELINNYE